MNLLAEIFGLPRKYDQGIVEVEYNCPRCDNDRNKFNMVVNTDNHVFHCWACGYKGTVDRLFWDHGNERHRHQWNDFKGKSTNTKDSKEDGALILTGFRSLRFEWKDSLVYKAARRKLKERKITKELIDKWDICYAEEGKYRDRIIIPSKNLNGEIEYFVARDIFDTQPTKYKNPPARKSEVIFGEKFIDWGKPVILTEGVFDAMVLYNSVPLLGSKIEGHTKLLRKIFDCNTPIILGFDEDKTGRDANIEIGKYLLSLGIEVYTIQGNEYGDLAKAYEVAGRDYIVRLIRNAQPFDELDLLINDLLQGKK